MLHIITVKVYNISKVGGSRPLVLLGHPNPFLYVNRHTEI